MCIMTNIETAASMAKTGGYCSSAEANKVELALTVNDLQLAASERGSYTIVFGMLPYQISGG